MTETLTILHPVKTVAIGGENVEVRELRWPDAIGFLQALSKQAGQFITPEGRLALAAESLPRVVQESGALVEYLLVKSTGRDAAWLRGLTPVEVLDLLNAAIELNASPELFARGKSLAVRLKTVFGKSPDGAPPTNSSPNAAIS